MAYTRKPSYKKKSYVKRKKSSYKYKKNYTVYKVVNKILARSSEIKFRPINVNNFTISGDEIYGINPAYHIPLGSTGDERDGIKIQNGMLYVRGFYKHIGQRAGIVPSFPWDSSYLRVIAFYTNKEWHNTSETSASPLSGGVGTNINDFEILYNYVPGKNAFAFTNRKDVKIVYDKVIKSSHRSPHRAADAADVIDMFPRTSGVSKFSFRVKLGNLTYQNSSTNAYPRFKQLIIAFMTGCPSPVPDVADEIGAVELQYAVKFNDF